LSRHGSALKFEVSIKNKKNKKKEKEKGSPEDQVFCLFSL
jgi:hypothetical protein